MQKETSAQMNPFRSRFPVILPTVIFLFLPASFVSAAESHTTAPVFTAQLAYQEGDVLVEEPEGSPAEEGPFLSLAEGTTVRTQKGSSCELYFGDSEGTVRLDENTQAVLSRIEPASVRLVYGKLLVSLKKKPRSVFTVETPTATTGARGTGWMQTVSSVEVFQSSVFSRNLKGDEVTVAEGTGRMVTDDGTFGEAFTLTQAARDAWNGLVSTAETHLASFKEFLGRLAAYESQKTAQYSGFKGPDMTILMSWQEPVNVDLWVANQEGFGRSSTLDCEKGPCFEMFRPWDLSQMEEDKKFYVAANYFDNDRKKTRVTISLSIPGRFKRSFSAVLDEEVDHGFWIAFSVDAAGNVEEINKFDSSISNYLST